MKYHYTLIRMVKYRTMTILNAGNYVEQQELFYIGAGCAKLYSHFGRWFGGFLKNIIL